MYFICKSALDALPDYKVSETVLAGNKWYHIEHWSRIDATLQELYQVDGMRAGIDAFRLCSGTLKPGTQETVMTGPEHTQASIAYKALIDSLRAVVGVYDSFQIPDRADGIDLKMPDGMSLDDFSALTKSIATALSQCPALNQADDSIQLIGTDIGSFWLSLSLIGPHLINRVASFVDKCMTIKAHYVTTKAMEAQYKMIADTNSNLNEMMTANKDFVKRMAEKMAVDFCEEHGTTQNDDISRTQMAIDMFGQALAQGVEVYAAVHSSDATKALFAPVEQQRLPQKAMQHLTSPKAEEAIVE